MFSMDSASGEITGRGTLSAYIDMEKKTSEISAELAADGCPERACVEYLLLLALHASDFLRMNIGPSLRCHIK